jgi:hypothetical protein
MDRWKTASRFDRNVVDQIGRLTNRNLHTEALILGAKMLGLTELVKKIELLLKLHKLIGYLPRSLSEFQHELYQEFMNAAKRVLTTEEFEALHRVY